MREAELDAAAVALERTMSWLRRAVRPTEWSAVALSTLDALDREGPLRVTDLVARERITQPGMTGLVGRLADAGLVERNADPSDGRVTLVAITPAGRDYLRSIREQRAALVAAHLRALTPEEQQLLVNACRALQALSARPLHPEEV
ncbi:MAG TPA: MarR family transcriptional regulator [Jatrophihabitantaceae bacterium]|nr:MarR family transcriptional regulator [Jatrophihabitantaceae bacterium]